MMVLFFSFCFNFFFFQAEDGIRDGTVTGVQTCALPILPTVTRRDYYEILEVTRDADDKAIKEIGRASCRERSVDLGGRRIIKKKKIKAQRKVKKEKKIISTNKKLSYTIHLHVQLHVCHH